MQGKAECHKEMPILMGCKVMKLKVIDQSIIRHQIMDLSTRKESFTRDAVLNITTILLQPALSS